MHQLRVVCVDDPNFVIPNFGSLGLRVQPTFPSEWFKKNPNKKPIICVPSLETSLDKLRANVYHQIMNKSIEINSAIAYLYKVFKNQQGILLEDWTTYGINIGKVGEKISIDQMFTVSELSESIDITESVITATEKDDKWMCLYLTALSRFQIVSDQPNSIINLMKTFKHHLTTLNAPPMIAKTMTIYENFQQSFRQSSYAKGKHPFYRQIVAAIDMFLYKFNDNPFSLIRWCTEVSRYNDCSAVKTLFYLSNDLLDTSVSEVKDWIWSSWLDREVKKMLNDDKEEMEDPYSYFPYFMDLRLSTKSPYSATENQNLHFFTHTIGCCMNKTKSINAHKFKDNDDALLQNAIIVGFAMIQSKDMSLKLSVTKIPPPSSKMPADWFIFAKKLEFRPTNKMYRSVASIWREFQNVRENTIGMWLKKYSQKNTRLN